MHRLFVALRPPAAIREALAAAMSGVARARWQDDDQLHLTLRFIGEVEGQVAEDVAGAVASMGVEAVTAHIAGVGSFGHSLWASVEPREPLTALHHKVDRALLQAGIKPDRRAFVPHITLARMPKSAAEAPDVSRWLAFHAGMRSTAFLLDRLILYESKLGSEGARYQQVMSQRLG